MSNNFVSGKSVVKNAGNILIGQILPLLVAIYSIPQLILLLGVERFGFLTLIWVVVGYLSIFDLGLGQALTKLIAEYLGHGEHEKIPPLFWTAMWLMCGLGITGMIIVEVAIPHVIGILFKVSEAFKQEAQLAMSVAALSLPFVVLSAGSRGALEAYQRFDLVNWVRIPLGLFTFLAPLWVASQWTKDLPIVAGVLVFGRILFLYGTMWHCFKILPALIPPQKIQRTQLKPLLSFGGWMTLTNLISPIMMYLDRFVIGSVLSMTAVAYYVTPYEAITKLFILPGALMGALFPAFATNLSKNAERSFSQFSKALDGIFFMMLPITMLMITYAEIGITLWLNQEFAIHATRVFQLLAIGVFVNSLGRVPNLFIQAAGRPDICARLHILELPLYLITLWFMLIKWNVEGAAIAWVLRVILDNLVFLISCACLFPNLKSIMWKGIAMTILPCLLFFQEIFVTGLHEQMTITVLALFVSVGSIYSFRQTWLGKWVSS